MHENQIYRKYSDEFRDVIERFPTKGNNLLMILLFVIVIVGFSLGWLIKSPDIILAEVKVTAQKPPVALVAKVSGNIKLFKGNYGEKVMKGEYIAIIENGADENQVKELKELLKEFSFDSIPNFEKYSPLLNYNLGEIQNSYFEFAKTIYELNQFYDNDKYGLESKLLRHQIIEINNSTEKRKEILSIKKENIQLSNNKSKIDSILVKNGAIIKNEYENSKKQLLNELESKAQQENEIIKNQQNVINLRDKILTVNVTKKETLNGISVALLTTYQNVLNELNKWEQNYVFIAPFEGELESLMFLTNSQFVPQGKPLFSILPLDNKIIGQALMPSLGAGKVKVGQTVTIKLDTYPYQEFGALIGKVKSISLIPMENVYLVSIDMPNKLKSDNNIELNFSKEMMGQAEIITEKRRLITRMFEKIKYSFDKKRKKDILGSEEEKKK